MEVVSIAKPRPIEIKRKTRAIPIKPSSVYRSEDYIAAALILIVIVSVAASLVYYAQGAFVILSTRPVKIALYKGNHMVATTEGDHLTTSFLSYGSYVLHAEKEGYEPVDIVLKPFARRTKEIKLDLVPIYGSIKIASEPSCARVEVHNSYQNKSCQTPCEMSELFAVKSRIEMRHPDYLPLVIEKEIPRKAALDLGTLAFKGSLKVDSDPSGAEVFLDGELRGTTPLLKDDLPAKPTKIEIRKQDSSRAYISKVSIQPQGLVDLGRVRLSKLGTLQLNSKPSGAKVMLNDKEVGVTPLVLGDVEAGSYSLRVEIPGIIPHNQTVKIRPSETINLGTISFTGSLHVTSDPSGADVYVDGKKIGITPITVTDLLTKQSKVEIKLRGYSPSTIVASIQPDKVSQLGEIKLKPEIEPTKEIDQGNQRSFLQGTPSPERSSPDIFVRSFLEKQGYTINSISIKSSNSRNSEIWADASKGQDQGYKWYKGSIELESRDGNIRITKNNLAEDDPCTFIRNYYEHDLPRHDINSAMQKWLNPNRTRLQKLVENIESFILNRNPELRNSTSSSADVYVDITGKNYRASPERWAGVINLQRASGEWKISRMNLSRN